MECKNLKLKNIIHCSFVQDFFQNFPRASIYLVGGAVRDYFLGIESSDFDFIVEGISWEELKKFLEKHGKVVWVEGRTFGTIKFRPRVGSTFKTPDSGYDFAIPRREVYEPGKRRKDAHVDVGNATIEEDLARRDFTINAMAIDLRTLNGKNLPNVMPDLGVEGGGASALIDPFNGLLDIKNKLIRAVGNPDERFKEDPTRILRGLRFAAKFDFEIEEKTIKAMQDLKGEIANTFINNKGIRVSRVSPEVIGQEFFKTIGVNPVRAIELYEKVGLLKLLFPEIEAEKGVEQPHQYHSEGDVFTHTKMALSILDKDADLELKVATLFHDIGKPKTFAPVSITKDRIRFNNHDNLGAEITRNILNRLKMPNKFIDDVTWLIKNHMRVIFAFPKMRIEKQKNFARNELVPKLLSLTKADTLASVDEKGKTFINEFNKTADAIMKIRAEAISKPREIINGDQIIKIILEINPQFNPSLEGKKIGTIKKTINMLYDKGEIKNKEEALERIQKWARKKASNH